MTAWISGADDSFPVRHDNVEDEKVRFDRHAEETSREVFMLREMLMAGLADESFSLPAAIVALQHARVDREWDC